MDIGNWIALVAVIFTALSTAVSMMNMWVRIQVKLKALDIEVTALKNQVEEMKNKHDKDIVVIRDEFAKMVTRLHTENREDHGKVFQRLDEMNGMLAGVCATISEHTKNHNGKK
jgi:hypothetical protein